MNRALESNFISLISLHDGFNLVTDLITEYLGSKTLPSFVSQTAIT